jgi:hypothetical protein
MAPEEHAAQVAFLVDQFVLLHHAIDPARHGHARLAHHAGRVLLLDPLEIDVPGLGEVLERAFGQAVVAGQRVGVGPDVGRALHVVVASEDVGAAAALADVAQRQLQDARRTHHRVADGVLRLTHAPHDGAGAVLGHGLGDLVAGGLVDAGDFQHLVGCPLGQHVLAHLVHAVDAVLDVLLVFPAVLEHVVQHAEQERDVGARAQPHELISLGRRAREARVDDDHLAAGFLGMQHVQHRHRVRFGRIRADVQRSLAVLHVVVGVGHRAIPPRVGHAGHGGGVADARLVVAVVAAPHRHPLAQQVRLFVVVLGRAHHVDAVGPAFLAQGQHLLADLVQRLVPADALVLAVDQLHRVLQPVLAVTVLAHGRALGTVRAKVDRAVEHRLLADPHAVLDHRIDGAANRAVPAHRALDFDLLRTASVLDCIRRLGSLDERELRRGDARTHPQSGPAQEGPAVHGGNGTGHATRKACDQRGRGGLGVVTATGEQHGFSCERPLQPGRAKARRQCNGERNGDGSDGGQPGAQTRAVW